MLPALHYMVTNAKAVCATPGGLLSRGREEQEHRTYGQSFFLFKIFYCWWGVRNNVSDLVQTGGRHIAASIPKFLLSFEF